MRPMKDRFGFHGNEGSGWIVITGTSSDARLPPPGQRVNPSHAAAMPKLVARPVR